LRCAATAQEKAIAELVASSHCSVVAESNWKKQRLLKKT